MAYADILTARRIEDAVWASLQEMRDEAIMHVPVDTGNLRNAITIATLNHYERTGPVVPSKAHLTGEIDQPTIKYVGVIGVNVAYGAAVEYGRPDLPNYPAQPFLRPAIDYLKNRFASVVAMRLKGSITLALNGTTGTAKYARKKNK